MLTSLHRADAFTVEVDSWLKYGGGPDVIWWFGGSRITKYAKKGLLHDLTDYWEKNPNTKYFSKTVVDAVRFENKVFAFPISTSLLALYYRKPVINALNIQLPETWEQLLETCKQLNIQDKSMFALGIKNTEWILHGWFDYLNLRLHGVEFYKNLLAGKYSFEGGRVRQTLEHLKRLLVNNCFNKQYDKINTWDVFPSIIRGYSAMVLATGIPEHIHVDLREELGLIEFPIITPNIAKYTVTPVEGFIVPKSTKLTEALRTFLYFLSTETFQLGYDNSGQHLPAILLAKPLEDSFIKKAIEIIKQSPGGTQFFDRDANINFSGETPKIFAHFLQHQDVDKTMKELESIRLKIYVK